MARSHGLLSKQTEFRSARFCYRLTILIANGFTEAIRKRSGCSSTGPSSPAKGMGLLVSSSRQSQRAFRPFPNVTSLVKVTHRSCGIHVLVERAGFDG